MNFNQLFQSLRFEIREHLDLEKYAEIKVSLEKLILLYES